MTSVELDGDPIVRALRRARFLTLMPKKSRITVYGFFVLLVICGCDHRRYRQSSRAMEPTIKNGEVIVADMVAYTGAAPSRWDVVVFTSPAWFMKGKPACSRVIGLPGESIEIKSQGIFINGLHVLPPAHIAHLTHLAEMPSRPPLPSVSFPFSIPSGCYFVLGDNTTNAYDSRYWGALAASNIMGRVIGK